MFRQYAPALAAGVLFALVPLTFIVLSLRARRDRRKPPSLLRVTLVICAAALIGGVLNVNYHHSDPTAFFIHMAVALGTFFVVFMVVSVPLVLIYSRSMPMMTETEREEMLGRQQAELETAANVIVASHGPLLLYGAGILAVFVTAILLWALFR